MKIAAVLLLLFGGGTLGLAALGPVHNPGSIGVVATPDGPASLSIETRLDVPIPITVMAALAVIAGAALWVAARHRSA